MRSRLVFVCVLAFTIVLTGAVSFSIAHRLREHRNSAIQTPENRTVPAGSAQTAAETRPLISRDLLGAPIPALCQHDAGRLKAGRLPLPRPRNGPDPGFASVLQDNTNKFLIQPVITDLSGDGIPELSGVLMCSAGGVSWPDVILVYSTGPKLLGYLDLGSVTSEEHSDVESMTASGQGLHLTWRSYEGCCFHGRIHTGMVHWDGTRVRIESVT
jgi:hypothetical protein